MGGDGFHTHGLAVLSRGQIEDEPDDVGFILLYHENLLVLGAAPLGDFGPIAKGRD